MPRDHDDRRPARPPARHHPALPVAALAVLALIAGACGASGPTTSPTSSPSETPSIGPSASPSSGLAASPTPAASVGSAQEQQLKAVAGEILAQVSELRGLELARPVETRVFDQAGLDAYVEHSFQKENTAADIAAAEGTYRRLGLLAADQSLERLKVELLGSQVLGLYDDETKALYVVARGEGIGGLEKFTMSHELDHALQDQHFDLAKLIPHDTDLASDVALAHLSVAEGDASLLMTQWATHHLTPQELAETIQGAADPQQQELLARMPAILTAPLQFPYLNGLTFVMERWANSGWRGVDALYARPPASTEQVLHPDKYAAGESPLKVELPDDLASSMGDGWKVADTDTFGEYLASVWLTGVGTDQKTATTAAAGWGGDQLAYLTGPGGRDVVIWRTAWDSTTDADEFLDAAGTAVGNGIGDEPAGGTVIRASDRDVVVILASDGPTLDAAVRAAGLRPAG